MDSLLQLDLKLFQFINSFHNEFWDVIMFWISNKFVWIPLYALLIFLIVKKFQKKSWLILLTIILMVFTSDQGANVFKNSFKRPRPCRPEAHLVPIAHTIDGNHCGKYGFFSAHAANSFAILVYLTYLLKSNHKKIFYFILPWAILNIYSRVYLGVHYPLDVLCGAVFGISIGFIFVWITKKYNLNT